MEKVFKLFVINPGSTSTRVAYYENEKEIYNKKLSHPSEVVAKYKEINDQFDMRKAMVEEYIDEMGITEIDAIVSRGGGGRSLHCGGYGITPLMVEECKRAPWPHASNLRTRNEVAWSSPDEVNSNETVRSFLFRYFHT